MYKSIFAVFTITLLVSCFGSPNVNHTHEQQKQAHKEALVEVNKQLLHDDMAVIENYIERRGWKMTMTQTGVWYQIYTHGNGAAIKEKQTIRLHYTVELLDGTRCYSSDADGKPKEITVGQAELVPGLCKHMHLLKRGDKARFVLPPHMAYGITGDSNKVPMRATIVYDIEIITE